MNTSRRRRTVLGAVVITLGAAAVGAALLVAPDGPDDTTPAAASPTGTAPVGAPAGGGNVAAGPTAPYTLKPEPTEVATDEPRPSDAGIDVVLTYAGFEPSTGTVQANGFVAGVLTDGGLCTLTLTNGDQEVTATSEAFADATTTSCGLVETGPGLARGDWEAVLSYSGVDSAPMEVSIP